MRLQRSENKRRGSLIVRNHQRTRSVDLRLLRRIVRSLMLDVLHRDEFDLQVHIVAEEEITRLNEKYLRHGGSTDVIAFDYSESADPVLRGEVFVCLLEAIRQAPRFHTTWQEELVRYVVHGILHLCGHDDQTPLLRRKMKQAENAALRELRTEYYFQKLGGHVQPAL